MKQKDKMVRFRLTAEEYKALKMHIAEEDITIQEFVHELVIEQLPVSHDWIMKNVFIKKGEINDTI